MFDQLAQVEKRYKEIEQRLYDPAVVSRVDEYQKLMKESSELAPLVQKYQEYKAAKQQGEDALALLDGGGLDKELRALAEEELADSKAKVAACAEELKLLLLPRDPNDDRNVIMEIRGGAESLHPVVVIALPQIDVLLHHPWIFRLHHMGGGAVHQSGLFAWEEDGIQGIRVTGAEDVLHGLACLLGQGSHAAHQGGFPTAGAALQDVDGGGLLRRKKLVVERIESCGGVCPQKILYRIDR